MYGGPRLYRFYNYEQVDYIPAPVGGWNPDVSPWELPENQAHVLDNFLLKPGKVVIRGGFTAVTDFSGNTPPLTVCGVAALGQFLIARKSNPRMVDPWNAVMLGSSAGVLASGSTGMLYSTRAGVITAVTAPSADAIIGPRWINFDGILYGISYDSAGAAVNDQSQSYFMKPLSLLTLSSSLRATQSGPSKTTSAVDTTFIGANASWAASSGGVGTATGYNWSSYGPGGVTNYLVCTGYGFNVPTGATITGIEVDVLKGCNYGNIVDAHVKIVKGGAVLNTVDRADTTTQWVHPDPAAQLTRYGNSADLWGTTWLPADINAGGFGAAFSAGYSGSVGGDGPVVYAVNITVYYTVTINTATPLPTVLTNAPHGAFDLKGHQSRIWLLGGIDTPGAGTIHKATAIFFSNPIVAGGGSATADWKDPVSGLTNQIVMDNNTADFGVALALVRGGLLVLRRSSLWLLRGSTTANYALTPISQVGCVDARSVVESDEGVYFMSQQGLMLTDGVKVVNVSASCLTTLQQAVLLEQQNVLAGNGGYVSCGRTSLGQILVSIGTYSAAGNIAPIWSALYDPNAAKGGAWVRITSQIFAGDAVQASPSNNYPGLVFSQRAPHMLYALGDKFLTRLEDQTQNASFLLQQSLYDTINNEASQTGLMVDGTVTQTGPGTVWTVALLPGGGPSDLSATLAAGASSEQINVTALGGDISIPVGARITGIEVHVLRQSTHGLGTDKTVQMLKAGVLAGQNKADTITPWSSVGSGETAIYGGPFDLWGTTWTPTDINNAGFGFALAAQMPPGATQSDTLYIHEALAPNRDPRLLTGGYTVFTQVTVYYSIAGSPSLYVSIPAVWKTKFAPIIGTSSLSRRYSHAKRYFCDYLFAGNGLSSGFGWYAVPVDATDTPYEPGMSVVSGAISSGLGSISGLDRLPTLTIQRQNKDFARELTDLGFDLSWSDTPRIVLPTNVAAEIYGIGIETQRTRDAR